MQIVKKKDRILFYQTILLSIMIVSSIINMSQIKTTLLIQNL